MNELVHRLSRTKHLRGDFAAANRQRSIEQIELDEDRRLVPIQVLVHDLVAVEPDEGDERTFDVLAGRGNAGQQPVHAGRVSESNDQLVDDLVMTDGPRDGEDLDVQRQLRQEVLRVEVPDVVTPAGADHQPDPVDV